jgi:tRNA 2-thiouridine synthesizing protein B
MILHHIQSSPNADNALKTCLRYACAQDSILLAGDAVTAPMQASWQSALASFNLLLLRDDVTARGLGHYLQAYKQVDYAEFVALSLSHDKVITW